MPVNAAQYVVSTNPARRKAWIKQGMLQAASKGFWTPYIGSDPSSVIHTVKKKSAAAGHVVTMDGYGKLTNASIFGEEQAEGKGETKRRFETGISMVMRRDVAKNHSRFASIDTGDLHLREHSVSLSLLSDKITRHRDQYFFDLFQGNCYVASDASQTIVSPSHRLTVGPDAGDDFSSFSYNTLMDIAYVLKTGYPPSVTNYPIRNPIMPTKDGAWLFFVTPFVMKQLRQDTRFQDLIVQALPRGVNNEFFRGFVGRIDDLWLIEMPVYMGKLPEGVTKWTLGSCENEKAGARMKDGAGKWSGEEGFNYSTVESAGQSECFIVGGNAIQYAIGLDPEYKYEEKDFGKNSESLIEWWEMAQRTRYNKFAGDPDYVQGIDNIDWSITQVTVKHATS